jgi:hypothetical protein
MFHHLDVFLMEQEGFPSTNYIKNKIEYNYKMKRKTNERYSTKDSYFLYVSPWL